jgi:hypothetical protein
MKGKKVYPEWVQKYRTRGTTVKKQGDTYYLYKRTSRRVPGKKYPQPVDTYLGVITPEGVVYSEKKKVSLSDAEVFEYGFSKALWDLCPQSWKKPLGDDWEDILKIIISKKSPESYLVKGQILRNEDEIHCQFPAQMTSLARRLKGEAGIEMDDLEKLKTVYMIHIDKTDILSKLSEEHMEIAARLGISLEI